MYTTHHTVYILKQIYETCFTNNIHTVSSGILYIGTCIAEVEIRLYICNDNTSKQSDF